MQGFFLWRSKILSTIELGGRVMRRKEVKGWKGIKWIIFCFTKDSWVLCTLRLPFSFSILCVDRQQEIAEQISYRHT